MPHRKLAIRVLRELKKAWEGVDLEEGERE